jgi:guanylate kinase
LGASSSQRSSTHVLSCRWQRPSPASPTCSRAPADPSYGTTFAALRELSPRRCVLDIDLQGVKQLHTKAPDHSLEPVFLFLSPPSTPALRERLVGRGTETDDSMRKRLDAAVDEINHALTGAHDIVIVNDDVARAGQALEAIALGKDGWEKIGDTLPHLDVSLLRD